jgi:hypothetical protein
VCMCVCVYVCVCVCVYVCVCVCMCVCLCAVGFNNYAVGHEPHLSIRHFEDNTIGKIGRIVIVSDSTVVDQGEHLDVDFQNKRGWDRVVEYLVRCL